MAETKRVKRRAESKAPNYLIIGPKGRISRKPDVSVVSGKTGEIRPVGEKYVDDLLKLVQERRKLGKAITDKLTAAGIIVNPKGTVIHLEEDED